MFRFIVAIALAGAALAPTWTVQRSGVTARLRGVSAASDRVAWASGAGNTILRTEDAGVSWHRLPSPSADRLDFRDIDAVAERTAYVLSIGAGDQSRIFKTTNGGASWTLQFTNDDLDAFYDAMAFWDANHGIAVSDSVRGEFVLLTTSNGGASWTRVPAAKLPPALPGEAAFAASGTNVTVWGGSHVWFGTGAGERARVLRSSDRGATWQIADTPIASGKSSGIYSVAFRDPLHGVIVGGDYARESDAIDNLAVTSDGGRTWTKPAGRLGGFRSAVAHVPGTARTFVAIGPLGTDMSIDDGHTWAPVQGPGFDTLSFAPARPTAWAAGARGAIGKLVVQ